MTADPTAILIAFLCGMVISYLLQMLLWAMLPLECACGYRCFWAHSMLLHTEAKHFHHHRGSKKK